MADLLNRRMMVALRPGLVDAAWAVLVLRSRLVDAGAGEYISATGFFDSLRRQEFLLAATGCSSCAGAMFSGLFTVIRQMHMRHGAAPTYLQIYPATAYTDFTAPCIPKDSGAAGVCFMVGAAWPQVIR